MDLNHLFEGFKLQSSLRFFFFKFKYFTLFLVSPYVQKKGELFCYVYDLFQTYTVQRT